MKNIYLLIVFLCCCSCNNSPADKTVGAASTMTIPNDSAVTNSRDCADRDKDREILKELFLYKCISYGYPEIEFTKLDSSPAVYFEIGHYAPEAYLKVDSLAKDFVSKISYEGTYYENEKTKGVFIQSFDYVKTKEFDEFVKSLDRYICQ